MQYTHEIMSDFMALLRIQCRTKRTLNNSKTVRVTFEKNEASDKWVWQFHSHYASLFNSEQMIHQSLLSAGFR